MPATTVLLYQEDDGTVPILEWLDDLQPKPRARCIAAIGQLAAKGHELVRPLADTLRDGIYELRIRQETVNYRILYFFHGRGVAVVSHGLTKEAAVPNTQIDRAVQRKAFFEAHPERHAAEYDP